MTSRGTPSPATNSDAPPVDDLVRVVEHALGQRGEQVDAERLVGRGLRTAAISSSSCSDDIVAAPSVPKPPASDTAATTAW